MKLFQEFLMFKYKAKDIPVNEVDVDMLKKYQHYLMTVRHNNNNTTVKYLRNLGKVLFSCNQEVNSNVCIGRIEIEDRTC